ncbi:MULTISPECIES: GNAT family N-acetyltransferase [unclassified Streptomyces]|uniref:GNAT family N-acetyltransferase n=1 Tax=unclassified Streptomyces TaxID=2593676 RepID=UPI000D140F42|nr:GNAT family N-acetyltransferase [Streptomyces sp. NRRL F-5135]
MCEVRLRDGADLEDCVRMLAEVHKGDGYPLNWPECPAEWLAQPAQFGAWVAEQDGRIVGHLALSPAGSDDLAPGLWSDRAGTSPADVAVVSRLFVSPSARGHGIGALLISQAAREARGRGLHAVLDVVATDTAAAALYERLGWSLLAEVDQRWSEQRTVTVRCYAAPL